LATLATADATIAVITALPIEFAAVQLILSASTRCQAPSGRIRLAAIVSNVDGSDHIVVVAQTSAMGNVPAAEAIAQVRDDCPRLQHVIFAGIAGGAPYPSRVERHVRLGDIVVATDCIVNYGNRKEHEERQEVRPQYVPIPDGQLTSAVRRLETAAVAGQRPWDGHIEQLSQGNPEFQRPPAETDQLIEANPYPILRRIRAWDQTIRHPSDPARALRPQFPRIFLGRIASADIVQANPTMRDQIRDEQNVRAFEMEGYGFSFGAMNRQLGYIVVRGICDYANPRKNRSSEDQWQRYAANVAAAYTLAIIRELPTAPAKQVKEFASFAQMLQRDGTSFTPVETALLQSIGSAIVGTLSTGLAAAQSGGARTTDSRPEGTEQLARDLLGNLDRAEELQRVYDFDQAFDIADQVEHQLTVVESALPPEASTEILFRLAKLEVSRADTVRIQDPNATPDYSRALDLLERANTVRRRP
jgi:nucleoside phosphorylase